MTALSERLADPLGNFLERLGSAFLQGAFDGRTGYAALGRRREPADGPLVVLYCGLETRSGVGSSNAASGLCQGVWIAAM